MYRGDPRNPIGGTRGISGNEEETRREPKNSVGEPLEPGVLFLKGKLLI